MELRQPLNYRNKENNQTSKAVDPQGLTQKTTARQQTVGAVLAAELLGLPGQG